MPNSDVTIVDYGIVNLFNIEQALLKVGAKVTISGDPQKIVSSERVILPGVGAYGAGIKALKQGGVDESVVEFAKTGRPLMGICLGMQLLMTEGTEFGQWPGLDLIPGKVLKFDRPQGARFKVPQIGWNQLKFLNRGSGSTFKNVADGSEMYFVHSYCVQPEDKNHIAAQSYYGEQNFCAVVAKENVMGCQFHPERSGPAGLEILRGFING